MPKQTRSTHFGEIIKDAHAKSGYLVQRGRVPKHYFMERFGLEKRG